MAYIFTDGEIGTKAKLDQIIAAPTLAGVVRVTPVANSPTSVYVRFPTPFTTVPRVVVAAQSTVSGGAVRGVSAANRTVNGFDLFVYRTNTTNTYVAWQAWATPAPIVTGQPIPASRLNQGGMVAQVGTRNVTPSAANTPSSATVTFPTPFASTPVVVTCSATNVPGSEVLGTAATEVEADGCRVWVTRTNTTVTPVAWIALGRI